MFLLGFYVVEETVRILYGVCSVFHCSQNFARHFVIAVPINDNYDTALLPGVFFFRFPLIMYRLEKFFFSVNNDVGSNEY